MNESDLRDLLPPERLLPAARRRDMKERLMEQINDEVRSSRQRYRVLAGALAAALLVIAGAVAVLASNDGDTTEIPSATTGGGDMTTTPPPTTDPSQGSDDDETSGGGRTVPEQGEVEQARLNVARLGSFQGLDADRVLCVDTEHITQVTADTTTNTRVRQLAFGDLLTEEMLFTECVSGIWSEEQYGTTDAYEAADATACVREGGYGPDNSVGNDSFLMPVIVLSGLTCNEVQRDNSMVREMTEADVAELNRMRAIEVGLMANPVQCPTQEQATNWADSILDAEGIDLEEEVWLMENDAPPPDCGFGPVVIWHGFRSDGQVARYGLQVTLYAWEPGSGN